MASVRVNDTNSGAGELTDEYPPMISYTLYRPSYSQFRVKMEKQRVAQVAVKVPSKSKYNNGD